MITTFGMGFYLSYLMKNYVDGISQKGDMLSIRQVFDSESENELLKGISALDAAMVKDVVCENTKDVQMKEQVIKGSYHKDYKRRMMCGEMFRLGENVSGVIIDDALAMSLQDEKLPIGKKIEINGQEYEVRGVCTITENDEIMVSVPYYIENFPTDFVRITFDGSLTKEKRKEVEELFEMHGIRRMAWKEAAPPWQDRIFMESVFMVMFIFVIIAINIFVVLYYLISIQRKKYCIYSVCGGSDAVVSGIIFGQTFLHLTLGCVCGMGAYLLFMYFTRFLSFSEWLYYGGVRYHFLLFTGIELIYMFAAIIVGRKVNIGKEIYQIEE